MEAVFSLAPIVLILGLGFGLTYRSDLHKLPHHITFIKVKDTHTHTHTKDNKTKQKEKQQNTLPKDMICFQGLSLKGMTKITLQ